MDLAIVVPAAAGAVILLGIAIGVFKVMAGKRRAEALEHWCRGAYSIWTGGEDSGTWAEDRARAALGDWYGATGPGPFFEVVKGLRSGQTGNRAWDLVRALDLLRIATAATILDADQCWTESGAIATELQRDHKSWEELAAAFEQGMQDWQRSRGITDPAQLGRVQRNLPALRERFWPAVRFDAKLVADE
jgi:hypothetical protein